MRIATSALVAEVWRARDGQTRVKRINSISFFFEQLPLPLALFLLQFCCCSCWRCCYCRCYCSHAQLRARTHIHIHASGIGQRMANAFYALTHTHMRAATALMRFCTISSTLLIIVCIVIAFKFFVAFFVRVYVRCVRFRCSVAAVLWSSSR